MTLGYYSWQIRDVGVCKSALVSPCLFIGVIQEAFEERALSVVSEAEALEMVTNEDLEGYLTFQSPEDAAAILADIVPCDRRFRQRKFPKKKKHCTFS